MTYCKKQKLIRLSSAFALLAIASPLISQLAADDQSIIMLEQAWDKKQASKSLADSTYTRLKQTGSLNQISSYAYLLVKIKQSDIRNALPAAEALLKLDPEHVKAHQAKTWLQLLLGKHESAITSLVEFDKANDAGKALEAEEKIENVRAMGRMYGYLSGPMLEKVSDVELRLALVAMLKDASQEEQNAFKASRLSVIEKFNSLLDEKSKREQDSIKQGEKEQADTLARLEKESDQLAERERTIAPTMASVAQEAKSDLAKIRAQATPLESEYRRLDSQAVGVRSDLNNVLNDAFYYEQLARREEDPHLSDNYLRRASSLRSQARDIESVLDRIIRQANLVSAALARAQAEYAATEANYNAQLNQLRKQAEEIRKQQKRVEGQVKRAQRPVTGITGGSKALQNKASGITSYEVFPVEREKARLLKILKN